MKLRLFVCFVFALANLSAATLLDVGGTSDTSFVLLSEDVAAVSFSLDAPATNVSISATFQCTGCTAVAYITTGLDTGYDQTTDLILASSISGSTLFTGLSLDAGTHFLVIANIGSTGSLVWTGATNPTKTSNGASHLVFWQEDGNGYNASQPPGSRFTFLTSAASPFYSVEEVDGGTGNEVPEPATVLLSAAGLAALGMLRRRTRA